jgi:hypothetical protein
VRIESTALACIRAAAPLQADAGGLATARRQAMFEAAW